MESTTTLIPECYAKSTKVYNQSNTTYYGNEITLCACTHMVLKKRKCIHLLVNMAVCIA